VLRRWVQELTADTVRAFPGRGLQKSEQLEIWGLRRDVPKLHAEREILKRLAGGRARRSAGCLPVELSRPAAPRAKRTGAIDGETATKIRTSFVGHPPNLWRLPRLMANNGLPCSMCRSDNVWDNAAMESSFSSLKTQPIGKKVHRTRDETRADVFDYVERFYIHVRRHSTIGYLSPFAFEKMVAIT